MNITSDLRPSIGAKTGPRRSNTSSRRASRNFALESVQALEARQLLATFTQTFTASVPVQVTDFNEPITLPKFDPSLGTLSKVDLSFRTTGSFNGNLTNTGTDPQTFTFGEVVSLALSQSGANLLSSDLSASTTYTNLAGGASAAYGPFNPANGSAASYTSGANFVLFGSGPGNVSLSVDSNTTQTTTGGGGNIRSVISTTAGASATVTYTFDAAPVTLAGNVYEDVLGTGVLATGDKPIPGTTLTLRDANGATVATTTTADDGTYSFTTTTAGGPLEAGTYSIAETQPTGYLQGTNTVGTVNGATDGTLAGVDIIGTIVLTAGQSSVGNNFGELLPVTISGNVYNDVAGTGFLLPNDPRIGGVILTLHDATGATVATTTTGTNGTYSFTTTTAGAPLAPGTYSVTETQPAGYLQGINTVGTVNGTPVGNLPSTDVIGSIRLTSDQASVNNNFGEVLPVTVSGNVYDDVSGTGKLVAGDLPIGGVTLILVDSTGKAIATTTTGADGTYAFTTLTGGAPIAPGSYAVVENQPGGYLQGTNTVGTVNGTPVGNLPSTDVISAITLLSGQSSIDNNFGEVLPVTISGNVYDDVIGTGSLVAGDLPIGSVTLSLVNLSGVVVSTTTTSAFGTYAFTTDAAGNSLAPGAYAVVETQPTSYLQGTNTVGTVNGLTDGDLPSTDVISGISLLSGQNSIGNNFGELRAVTIAGTVYNDLSKTGSLQPGDPPIAGVTLALYNGATFVASTTTDAFGNYLFSTTAGGQPIPPGVYTVFEFQPAGFAQGTNTVGTVNGVTDGNLPAIDVIGSINLTSGQSSIGNNFGEISPGLSVTNVQRFGVHLQPTLVYLTFSTPLDPASAQNVANYKIFGPTDSKTPTQIPIDSATYNASTNSVTLRLGERLQVHHPYRLTVSGVTSVLGDALPGGTFVTTLARNDLAGFTDIYGKFIPINHGKLYPAAAASGYQLKHFKQPANLGSFAQANTSAYLAATAGNPEPAPITFLGKRKLTSGHHH